MDTAGGRPVTTLIMAWRCATQTERYAHSHTCLPSFKMKSFPLPHCSYDSRIVLGSVTMSFSSIHYLIISNSHIEHGNTYLNFKKDNIHTLWMMSYEGEKWRGGWRIKRGGKRREKDAALIPSLLTLGTHGWAASCSSSSSQHPIPLSWHYIAVLLIPTGFTAPQH